MNSEKELELMGGSGRPSPFHSLSQIFQGFCDPESSVRDCDDEDDDVYNKNDFHQKKNDKQKTQTEVIRKREVMPSKYLHRGSANPKEEEEMPSLVCDTSNNNDSVATENKELPGTAKDISALEDEEPLLVESKSRSINFNSNNNNQTKTTKPKSILLDGTKNKGGGFFDVVADSRRKKRVNRIFDAVFYTFLGVILTIFSLRMMGKVVFNVVKPPITTDARPPINFGIKKEEVVTTRLAVEEEEEVSSEYISIPEEEDNIQQQQSCENVEDNNEEFVKDNEEFVNNNEEKKEESLNISKEI